MPLRTTAIALFLTLLAVLLSGRRACAQGASGIYSSFRVRTLANTGDTLRIDSLSIEPGSLHVQGAADSAFTLLPFRGLLVWKARPVSDSLTILYRVLPLDLSRNWYNKDRKLIDSSLTFEYTGLLGRAKSSDALANYDAIEYNGSYGRSLSVGNNQDVVLNSQFNLQVSGYLPDSIRLDAAITDNTLPVQPEGNTATLQEFDQIYIRLSKARHTLQAGDYNLERPKGYFLSFYKRVQGLYYTADPVPDRRGRAIGGGLSGSVAKGRFARNIFFGAEGNQGPYKLTGNNGEQFFIVLANTERVFINGLLQERGESRDYIINYNTAEVTFMPRRLITKDSRIQIEFEYQDRTYLNSLIYAWTDARLGPKVNMHLNVYSNQDSRSQSFSQSLNTQQKIFLAGVGDSISNAFYPNYTIDTPGPNKVLYRATDTIVNGIAYDTVFVYSTHPDSAQYNLNFAFVGPGRGDYIISPSIANGRVYQWVPRENGVRRGDYAPAQFLITPKKHQVVTLATTYRIDSSRTIGVETAASVYDPNLFSSAGAADHLGLAARATYAAVDRLMKRDSTGTSPLLLQTDASWEKVTKTFRAVAPYRNIEFNRDWNINPAVFNNFQQNATTDPAADFNLVNGPADEQLASLSLRLLHRRLGTAGYSISNFNRQGIYAGTRHVGSYTLDSRRWYGAAIYNILRSRDTGATGIYTRPSLYGEFRPKKLALGFRYDGDHNALRSIRTDTLLPTSLSFDVATVYLRSNATTGPSYSVGYTLRRDAAPVENRFLQQNHSRTADLRFALPFLKTQRVAFTGSYRQLLIDDTTVLRLRKDNTLLARMEYTGSVLNGALQGGLLYEAGSGQEQRRSYTYVEVPAGQGQYFWNDYNGDGVQQANEFELAIYPDQRRFIRFLTLTNEYVRAAYNNTSASLTADPALFFKAGVPKAGFGAFLSRLSVAASLQSSVRLLSSASLHLTNPFSDALDEASIISTTRTTSATLFFNQRSVVAGADYSFLRASSKALLVYGVEGQSATSHTLRSRWNVTRSLLLSGTLLKGDRSYVSALSDGRSFKIDIRAAEPAATLLLRSRMRITTRFRLEDRKNAETLGGQHAAFRTVVVESRYTTPGVGAIQVHGNYTGITYNGEPGTSVSFVMLDALQPGANYLWGATWERRVGRGIELSLEYDGRKPATGTPIHTGRMSIRAIL